MLIIEAVRYLIEIAPKRAKKKIKESYQFNDDRIDEAFISMINKRAKQLTEAKESLHPVAQKLQKIGHSMIDYSEHARPDRKDDQELSKLNMISKVGHKLTNIGTDFGPNSLTDLEKKVIKLFQKRVGKKIMAVAEDMVPNIGSNPSQSPGAATQPNPPPSTNAPGTSGQTAKPTTQTGPNNTAPVPNGMLSISKAGATKTIPAAQLAGMQSQGWTVNGSSNNNG
jgi:hypothetical protein